MKKSSINIDVLLDANNTTDQILWSATDSTADKTQSAKALMLAFWDGADKTALRIDLWTKDMMVDEMADFFYQCFSTMADTYQRATQQTEQANDIKEFAKNFYTKFRQQQLKSNKA
jgi:gliding motility-associated protein GldC